MSRLLLFPLPAKETAMTTEEIRSMVNLIRKLVDSEHPSSDKREAIEVESSDEDMLAIHEFCSWFTAELDEGNAEGGAA